MLDRCLNGQAPQYLAIHCVPLSNQRHHLHSATARATSAYTADVFSAIAGTSNWNSLPDSLCNLNTAKATFRCLL